MFTMIEEGIYFEEVDMEEVEASGSVALIAAHEKLMAVTGGCFATEITDQVKANARNVNYLTEDDLEKVEATPVGFHIQMYKQMMVHHTTSERKALMFHELGHIRLQHLVLSADDRALKEAGKLVVINNLDHELAADSFAANRVSKNAMASGLVKCLKAQAEFISALALKKKGMTLSAEEIFSRTMESPEICARLKALR